MVRKAVYVQVALKFSLQELTANKGLAHSRAHSQWGSRKEKKFLRPRWRSLQGCHCSSALYHVKHGCKAEQVGPVGVQKQIARLHKVCLYELRCWYMLMCMCKAIERR